MPGKPSPSLLWRRREYIRAKARVMRLRGRVMGTTGTGRHPGTLPGIDSLGREGSAQLYGSAASALRQATAALDAELEHERHWLAQHEGFDVEQDRRDELEELSWLAVSARW